MVVYSREFPGNRPGDERFNTTVEETLTFCEREMAALASASSAERYALVMERVRAVESWDMAEYQYIRLLAVAAEALYFLGDGAGGMAIARRGIELTKDLQAAQAARGIAEHEADIARLQGELRRRIAEIQRRNDDFVGGAESYGLSIEPLWRAASLTGWVATDSLRDSLARCIGLELLAGEEERAAIHLDLAVWVQRRTRLDDGATTDATIAWMQAIIHQRAGRLTEARASAQHAATVYLAAGPKNTAVRILWVVLEIVLDLAESYKAGHSARKNYVGMAQAYHGVMTKLAKQGKDGAGIVLARLAGARLNRLARPSYGMAVAMTRRVMEQAARERATTDWATVCQARMAYGRELLARAERLDAEGGPRERQEASAARMEARSALEQAVAEARAHGSPGLVWWALRLLAAGI